MTDTCRERENFYRNSTLIVDHSNEACTGLLHHDLTKQGLTLLQLIEAKQHEIYHMCYNNKPCCLCPPGSRAPVFRHINRILNPAQLDILLDTTAKLPGHNPNSQTNHCCCPANPKINYDQLDLTLTRCLLLNFTTVIPDRSPERLAVDELIKFRNESYGHATNGKISDHDYQIIKAQIEKSIIVLAQAQRRESEFKQKLSDAAVRPLDETILRLYQTKLMENIEMMQTLKKIESAVRVKSLPGSKSKETPSGSKNMKTQTDVPVEAKDRHAKLTTDLSKWFHRSQFKQLKTRLQAHLDPSDLMNVNDIMDIVESLEKKGKVAPGRYEILKTVLMEFDTRIVENLIEPAEQEICQMIDNSKTPESCPGSDNELPVE